eukprot:4229649-Prorocentrum_lima.AAC.1
MSSTPESTAAAARLHEPLAYTVSPSSVPNTADDVPEFVVSRASSLGKALEKCARVDLSDVDAANWAVRYD